MPPKKGKSLDPPKKTNKTKKFDTNQKHVQAPQTSIHKWKYADGKTPDLLNISSWNVNGIRAVNKKGQFRKYLESQEPDMLCIGQTKIDQKCFQQQDLRSIIPKNYYQYWNFCKANSGYSGVAIFSKYAAISCKQDLGIPKHDQQGRMITLEFDKFYLITGYIPNAGQGLVRLDYRTKQWDIDFLEYIEQLKQKKNVIICGDLNVVHQRIDIAKPDSNQRSAGFTKQQRQNFSKWLQKGWVDTFRYLNPGLEKYSWWSSRFKSNREKNIGWRLDYFVVNQQMFKHVKDSGINNNVFGSDHCPVQLQIAF